MKILISKAAETALGINDAPPLTARAGEVVIDVRAIGVGRVDLIMRQMAPSPFVPGIEVAGIVVETGDGVDHEWRGQPVFARVQAGAYAEQAIARSATLVALPDGLAFETAVATGVNALVAHFCLERACMVNGERVVVRGARGGIGHLAVQMARRLGGDVLDSLASGEPIAADVVIDLVGGPDTGAHLAVLDTNGRYVLAGIAAGMPPVDFASALLKEFRRSRSVATLSLDTIPDAEINVAATRIFADAAAGRIVPNVATTLPLDKAEDAHRLLKARGLSGKVVLVP
jgi:NADPH:quinone reductase